MSTDISFALLINLAILLALSWAFFLVVFFSSHKKNKKKGKNSESKETDKLKAQIKTLENQLQEKLRTIDQQQPELQLQQEIPTLNENGHQLVEDLESQLNEVQNENLNLRDQLDDYIAKNRRNSQLIDMLQDKLHEVQQVAAKTQTTLDNKIQAETGEDSIEKVLQRTENERRCIEQQYMELSAQLEEADTITEQLDRSQKECAQLEHAYLEAVGENSSDHLIPLLKTNQNSIPQFSNPEPEPEPDYGVALAEESPNEFAIDTSLEEFKLDLGEFDFEENEYILDNSESDPDFNNDDFGKPTGVFAEPTNSNTKPTL